MCRRAPSQSARTSSTSPTVVPNPTTIHHSTAAGSRLASSAPRYPPAIAAGATMATPSHDTGPNVAEHHDGDQADGGGQDVLQRVDPLQPLVEDEREHRDEHDAERGAEVAAVDRPEAGERGERRPPPARRKSRRVSDELLQPTPKASSAVAPRTRNGTTSSNARAGVASSSAHPATAPTTAIGISPSTRRR